MRAHTRGGRLEIGGWGRLGLLFLSYPSLCRTDSGSFEVRSEWAVNTVHDASRDPTAELFHGLAGSRAGCAPYEFFWHAMRCWCDRDRGLTRRVVQHCVFVKNARSFRWIV